jgi:tRNA(fMet)-specific endonuclease VapC
VILLDTDHLSVLRYADDPRHSRLNDRVRIAAQSEILGTTIISVEEQLRGWLARLHAERSPDRQILWYAKLTGLLSFFQAWRVEPFDHAVADKLMRLRSHRIRIGTQDLKIAAIALTRDALLLTSNQRDFSRGPGLRVEDWLS